jgi:HSP20 family molecular chaperone IbpA
MNNAMQEIAFFSDLMNIDSGWDRINISPAMDMREKNDSYEINFSIPDGTTSNVTVELNGQLLNMYIPIHISKPGYNEFRTYKQQILIPGPINTNEEIKATISNNVLRVILPKAI